MIRLLFFASLREALNTESENHALETPMSIAALRARLAERGPPWSDALAPEQPLLAAINQTIVQPDALIRAGDEVAFFPPVTGG